MEITESLKTAVKQIQDQYNAMTIVEYETLKRARRGMFLYKALTREEFPKSAIEETFAAFRSAGRDPF